MISIKQLFEPDKFQIKADLNCAVFQNWALFPTESGTIFLRRLHLQLFGLGQSSRLNITDRNARDGSMCENPIKEIRIILTKGI
jgi:hypothetical protein